MPNWKILLMCYGQIRSSKMLFILMFIIWAGPFERVIISMTCCVIRYFIISVIQLQWKIFRIMMIISLITFVHRKFHDRIIMNFITAVHFNILMPFYQSYLLYQISCCYCKQVYIIMSQIWHLISFLSQFKFGTCVSYCQLRVYIHV